jgi:hypothetical protein
MTVKSLHYLVVTSALAATSHAARGQMQFVSEPTHQTQSFLSGDARSVHVTFQNPTDKMAEADLRIRLHQTSSATTVLVSDQPWKKLQVLPGQTVLESAKVSFPAVKGETRFLTEWTAGTSIVLGKTEVLVYPPDMLKELKALCGDDPLGVYDPQNVLKPLLKSVSVEIADLEDTSLEDFHGKLAILGPFQSKAQMREGFTQRVTIAAAKGTAFVWIQPPPDKRAAIKPSFYAVHEPKAAIVIVQATELRNFPDDPQSQLNLIRFCRFALRPEPLRLPFSATEH